jgi:hypothetical protein
MSKATADMGRVEKSEKDTRWFHLVGCVLDVFYENERRESEPGALKAQADTWGIHSYYRKQITERACKFWCDRTGSPFHRFPLNEDKVAALYFRIRKRQSGEVEGFDQEIAEAGGEYSIAGEGPSMFDDLGD